VGGSISGTVTNDGGAGIPDVYVYIYSDTYDWLGSVSTNASGIYTIHALPSGTYKVSFDPGWSNDINGTDYLGEWYENAADFDSADPITVTAPNDTPLLDAVLEVGGSISGTVSDGTNPISDVYVSVYDSVTYNYLGSVSTDASGIYTVHALPSGTCKVEFNPSWPNDINGTDYLGEWYNDAADSTAATPITVTAPNAITGINAFLEEGGSISGTVTDGTDPIYNVAVWVYDSNGILLGDNYDSGYFTKTDADGNYAAHGLAPGPYKVYFNPSAHNYFNATNYVSEFYNNKRLFNLADGVTVTAPNVDTPSIDGILETGPTCSIDITDSDLDGVYYHRDVTSDALAFSIGGLDSLEKYAVQFGYVDDAGSFIQTDAVSDTFTTPLSGTYNEVTDVFDFTSTIDTVSNNPNAFGMPQPLAIQIGTWDGSTFTPLTYSDTSEVTLMLSDMNILPGEPKSFTLVNIYPPSILLEAGSETTDFSAEDVDLFNLVNPVFHDLDLGKIAFNATVDVINNCEQFFTLEGALNIATGEIGLNSNVSFLADHGATLMMEGLTLENAPLTIYACDDGGSPLDSSALVSNISYDSENSTLTFDAAHFTTYTVDYVAPVVTINNPVDSFNVSGTVTIDAGVVEDNPYTVSVRVDGTEVSTSLPYDWDTTTVADGSRTITVVATDETGNTGTDEVTVTVDNTAPVIVITGVADGAFYNAAVTPIIDVIESNLSTTEATLNGSPFTSGTEISADGSYTLVVTATDLAGDLTTETVNFTIDATAPVVAINNPVDSFNVSGIVTIDAGVVENNPYTVSVRVDGAEVSTSLPYDWDTTTVADGSRTINVVATDETGNTGTDEVTVTVDNTAPTLTTPVATINDTTATVTWSAEDVTSGIDHFDTYIDGELHNSGTETISTFTITPGTTYTFKVEAYDVVGNLTKSADVGIISSPAESTDITVDFVDSGVSITLPEVTMGGSLTAAITTAAPALDISNNTPLGNHIDISTTAIYAASEDDPIIISFNYGGLSGITNEANLRLNHHNGTAWENVTDHVDTVNHIIYGKVTSLSPFVISQYTPASLPPTGGSSEEKMSRVSGDTRYETAVEISKKGWTSSEYVVIATGSNFPDALSGVPLAKAHEAPMLLVEKDNLPTCVKDEINRLGATKAIILGGTGAVSDTVKSQITSDTSVTTVERIGGTNRYDTAKKIAIKLMDVRGVSTFGVAMIVTGENFPDALSASCFAGFNGYPILPVTKDSVPAETKEALDRVGASSLVVVGGTAVISDAVKTELNAQTRVCGQNRYETAREMAKYATDNGMNFMKVMVGTGTNFPDALTGGAFGAMKGAQLLLVDKNDINNSSATKDCLTENKGSIISCYILGGTGAISENTMTQIDEILGN